MTIAGTLLMEEQGLSLGGHAVSPDSGLYLSEKDTFFPNLQNVTSGNNSPGPQLCNSFCLMEDGNNLHSFVHSFIHSCTQK